VVSITNDGLLLGRTYLYRVVSFNEAGESAPSAADAVTTPSESELPPVPTGLKAELVAPRAIKLTWNDVASETGYVIERRVDGTTEPYARVGTVGADVTTFTQDGLLAGKTYLYRVRSVNAVGTSSPSPAAFATTPPEVGTTAPATPREFSATLVAPRAARLNWSDVTGETGYRVERRVDGSADDWAVVATLGADVTTYAQDGLAAGKTYLYRVRAFNAAGASEPTAARAVAVPGESTGVPAAPHLESLLVAPRAIRLAWTNVSNESGYRVERRVDGSTEPFKQIAVTADEVTRYVDEGLEPGKTYLYRVRAFNAAGNSAYSNTVARAVPGEIAVPATPTGVEATLIAPRAARVTWKDVEGESGYRVERRVDASGE
jgi:predicted phage tail protein